MRTRTSNSSIFLCGVISAVVFGFSPAGALAGELPSNFTLTKAIPGDCWMVINGVHNPERDWIEKEWAEVFEAFKKSGITQDLFKLFLSHLSEEDRAETESVVATFEKLITDVKWDDLMRREMVFAERLTPPLPSYILLTRGSPGSAEENATAIAAIMKQIALMVEEVEVKEHKLHGADLWSIEIHDSKDLHFQIDLFRRGDVVGLVFAQNGAADVLGLLAGKGKVKSIVDNPRFKKALTQVTTPEDMLGYFDYRKLFSDIRGMVDWGMSRHSDPSESDKATIEKILKIVDIADYGITTMRTEGVSEITDQLTVLQADKLDSPLARCFMDRKPFDKFDKYVPADATGFSVSTFFDLGLVYHTILEFIEENIPDGRENIAEFKATLAEIGFDPDADLFSWYSGEIISVQMPAAVVTPFGGADSVTMIRVKDAALASEKVNTAIVKLSEFLAENFNQQLTITPAEVQAEGFQKVTHPLVAMMMLAPVVGVVDGEWLMIGTSAQAVDKCLAVAAGKAPSFRENPRFKKEGIVPTGPVAGASFTDISKVGEEMAAVFGMVGMFGGLGIARIPEDDPDAREVKQTFQKLFGIMMKLSPVVAKIDFFSSKSSLTTVDGHLVRAKYVTTYKAPVQEKSTLAATGAASP